MMKGNPNLSPRGATSDTIQYPSTLDPELSSFFLVRGNTDSNSTTFGSGSSGISPLLSRARSQGKTSKSRRSGESRRSNHGGKASSTGSAVSIPSKYPNVTDWNDRNSSDFSGPSSYTSTQRHAIDPPRPAREGMEWVWFPEGYWAEREWVDIRPKKEASPKKWFTRSPSRNGSGSTQNTIVKSALPTAAVEVPRIQIVSLRRQTDASDKASLLGSDSEPRLSKLRMGFNYMSPRYPHFISPSGEPEGLYCKTRRNVGGRFVQRPKRSLDDSALASREGLASQTTMVLEGASSYFERVQKDRNHRNGTNLPSTTPLSPASPGARSRRFGMAPWHRRTSHESLFSVTSSVHRLLMGRTPAATPNSAGTYVDRDGRSYPKVEISDSDQHGHTFLPSEARRIKTPPMPTGTPDIQTRGFFFDTSPPTDESKSEAEGYSLNTNISRESIIVGKPSNVVTPSRDWWETEHPFTPSKSTGRITPKILDIHGPPPISPFELNLPEHLQNSPLCPKNPMHKSGGTGICVYHGRMRWADTPESNKGFYEA